MEPIPLTAAEADAIRDDLIEGWTSLFALADTIITHTNRQHETAFIWGAIETRKVAAHADLMLKRGRRSGVAAEAARKLSSASLEMSLAVTDIGKAIETLQFYAEHGGFYVGFLIPSTQTAQPYAAS